MRPAEAVLGGGDHDLPCGTRRHTLRHMSIQQTPDPRPTARIEWNNGVQTVSIPVDFRFPEAVREVFIRREGESIVLTPRPSDWSGFFASGAKTSSDFMAGVECLPVQGARFDDGRSTCWTWLPAPS